MELAKSWFVRKNVKKIQEKFLLLKSFYYICTRGLLKYRAPVWTTDLHFPLRAKHVCTRGLLKLPFTFHFLRTLVCIGEPSKQLGNLENIGKPRNN